MTSTLTTHPDLPAPAEKMAPGEKIVIPVSGMTCAACQSRVQRTLNKVPGVSDASVNLMMGSATVSYDPSAVPARIRFRVI